MTISVADFGTFTGPVLLCGGAVSNLEALEELEAQARHWGIAPHQIIHTGDAVAYSLGLPANDGTPRGWYSIAAPAGETVRLSHFGFGYDHRKAAAKMRANGLPEGYADCLETGLWPTLDVLLATERAAAGQALHLNVIGDYGELTTAAAADGVGFEHTARAGLRDDRNQEE